MREIRIRFRKTGRAKYISHLDLTRTMTRAVRRASIPLWYTEGFNRHPYLTFASPLSLGFEGLCESMDIRLIEDILLDELVERLNSVLPEGIEVIKASEPVMKTREIAYAVYQLTFPVEQFPDFNENIREFVSQDSITVEKKTKKGAVRRLELKPELEKAVININDNSAVIEVVLPCSSKETINPNLLCSALNDFINKKTGVEQELIYEIVRINLLNNQGIPFE
jgi:radical SAM-linked protein